MQTSSDTVATSEYPPATIPQDLAVISVRPDIMIVHNKEIQLLELTIPFDSPVSFNNAHWKKSEKRNYQILMSDLDTRGVKTFLSTLEIGVLGHSLLQTLLGL